MNSNLRILCTGWVCDGDVHLRIPPPPVEDEPTIGELQDIIDIANADADAEEYMDFFLDQEREGR